MTNKARLQLWVEDLESGQHKQTQGTLHRRTEAEGDRYCCLGRLCELAVENGLDISVQVIDHGANGVEYMYDGMGGYSSTAVDEWAGITSADAFRYADMNDEGSSFEEIAAAIREDFRL